jgi:subtilisin family serine protease
MLFVSVEKEPVVKRFRPIVLLEAVWCLAAGVILWADPALAAPPERGAANVLAEIQGPLADPALRQRAAAEIHRLSDSRRTAAQAWARQRGLPLRVERPDGHVRELADVDDDRPVYLTTHNANAAISTGANLLHTAPYLADGAGGTIGIWDAGSVRATHREFGGRVNVMDGAAAADHSTHVGGTIGAAGVAASAKGMAPAVTIASYDWNSDLSEMTAAGAAASGQSGKIQISNHSYGYVSGWGYVGASPKWVWYGSGTTAASFDGNFGKYNTYARDIDSVANSLPYYQIVISAGNDRNNNPVSGEPVAFSPASGAAVVSYDPALHPPGDGAYRSGYDTIGFYAVAKNVLTIGSVRDAVSGGARAPSMASMEAYSSWGPTDDGRIKPDLVANGSSLYSTWNAGGDASYNTQSGTSMAGPNAAGTAQQLVQIYGSFFPGQTPRASLLKALLIHTADDLGATGPDYRFGWGLVNGKAAADLLAACGTNAGTACMAEDRISASRPSVSTNFAWDGASPIRATLCWTDPAGASTTLVDSRTARLVNNLDLSVTGPDGATFLPWVMPFVGNWGGGAYELVATTGTNSTDNVEQVLILSPPASGTYTATVSCRGSLSGGGQTFSLVVSGAVARQPDDPPEPPAPPKPPLQGGTLLAENFEAGDTAAKGWTMVAADGTSQWAPSTAKSVSPSFSMHSPGTATHSDTSLVSPGVELPAGAAAYRLSFWHDYAYEGNDAGVLEFSLDGGDWFDVADSASGAVFSTNGYTGTVGTTFASFSQLNNPLKGRSAWTGASGGFLNVTVQLTDLGKYAGRTLRVRWRLGTDAVMASAGWYVDDVTLSAIGVPSGSSRGTVMEIF